MELFMKKITREDLRKAFEIIDGEMEKLAELHDGGEYLISPAVGAKILGISLQAMEERIKNDSFQIHDSFGKRFLSGQMIRNHFHDRVDTLTLKFDSLNKLQASSLRKIVDYANILETKAGSYPPS